MSTKEKLILFPIISVASIVGYWQGGPWAGLIAGLIVVLVDYVIALVLDNVTPTHSRRIFCACVLCMIPLAVIGAIATGNWIPWSTKETVDHKLEAEIAQAKTTRKAREEKEAEIIRAQDQKAIELRAAVAAQNIADVSDKIDALQKSVDERFDYDRGRLDALTQSVREDRKKLNGLLAPKPPAEAEVEIIPPPVEVPPPLPPLPSPMPPPKAEEKKAQPRLPIPIPQTEPKAVPRELRVKVACNCGKIHPIKGWWHYPNGMSIPDYTPCVEGCNYQEIVLK